MIHLMLGDKEISTIQTSDDGDIGPLTSQDEVSGLVDLVQCSLHALQPPGRPVSKGGIHVAELR